MKSAGGVSGTCMVAMITMRGSRSVISADRLVPFVGCTH